MALAASLRAMQTSFGLSDDALAARAGLPLDRLRALLDDGPASSVELYHLADTFGLEPGDLLQPARGLGARFLRGDAELNAQTLPDTDRRLLNRAQQLGRVGLKLWRLMRHEAPGYLRHVRPLGSPVGHPGEAGYLLGGETRRAFGEEPIIALQALVEGLGVHVARVMFTSPDVLGVSVVASDGLPVVLLNERTVRVREPLKRRAVLAHELCHLLHDGSVERPWHVLVSPAGLRDPVEARANAFAPAFLAPARGLDPAASADALFHDLTTRWGLSPGCAAHYLHNLRGLDEATIQRLSATPPAGASFEPAPPALALASDDQEVSPLVDGLIARLALEAAAAHEISTGRLAEILELG